VDETAREDLENAQRELRKMENMLRSMRGATPEAMGIFTLVVTFGGEAYTTQVGAPSAQAAVASFLDNIYPTTALKAFGPEAPELGSRDLIYVTPMEGLANVWAVCAGRAGKYISAVCARTESSDAA
jgi:hypothetical protein